MKRILGIDPGLAKGCGVADIVFSYDWAEVSMLKPPGTMPDAVMAAWYADEIAEMCRESLCPSGVTRPAADVVAIEGQFAPIASSPDPKKRKAQMGIARATNRLSKLVGGIMAILWSQGIRVIEIAPGTGKNALTGNGFASPGDMDTWARRLYGFAKLTDDEAHACGIALAGQRVLLLERKRTSERKKVRTCNA